MSAEMVSIDRILKWLLAIFIVWDIGFSFYQHYHSPIGGDIAQVVIPTPEKGYYEVLQDPFGVSVLKGEKAYSNPNKYFIHLAASKYLLNAPLALQQFVEPIPSIYLSIALLKTITQLALLVFLIFLIPTREKPLLLSCLFITALLSSLFQTSGFNRVMGIIDPSVIYTFFYAFPMVVLGIFLVPIIRWFKDPTTYSSRWYWILIMLVLSIPLAMGGALISGVALVGVLTLLLWVASNYLINRIATTSFLKEHRNTIYLFVMTIGWLCLWCLYSLLVNSQNEVQSVYDVGLAERYAKLPAGLWGLFTNKLGPILLVGTIVLNTVLIRKAGHASAIRSFKWLAVFILIYILLLPLGGYRDYRPNILRYDTVIPVTFTLFYMLGKSGLLLLDTLKGNSRRYYQLALVALIIIFSVADTAKTEAFRFEYNALQVIADSEEELVVLDNTYPVIEFRIVHEPDHSNLKAALLTKWNVTERDKLFYQRR